MVYTIDNYMPESYLIILTSVISLQFSNGKLLRLNYSSLFSTGKEQE